MKASICTAFLLLCWLSSTAADYPRFPVPELPHNIQRSNYETFASRFKEESHAAGFSQEDARHHPSHRGFGAFPHHYPDASMTPEHHARNGRELAMTWWRERLTRSAKDSKDGSWVFYPTANGADPTGSVDSTSAVQKTINQAFEVASKYNLLGSITDLGGVQVHLGGGQYAISEPLTIPDKGGGNVMVGLLALSAAIACLFLMRTFCLRSVTA